MLRVRRGGEGYGVVLHGICVLRHRRGGEGYWVVLHGICVLQPRNLHHYDGTEAYRFHEERPRSLPNRDDVEAHRFHEERPCNLPTLVWITVCIIVFVDFQEDLFIVLENELGMNAILILLFLMATHLLSKALDPVRFLILFNFFSHDSTVWYILRLFFGCHRLSYVKRLHRRIICLIFRIFRQKDDRLLLDLRLILKAKVENSVFFLINAKWITQIVVFVFLRNQNVRISRYIVIFLSLKFVILL